MMPLAKVIKTGIRNNVQQVDISNFLYYVKKLGRYSDNELNTKQKKISDKKLRQNALLINKKISGAVVLDILDNIFHCPMDEIDKLKIERIKIL